MTIRLVLTSLVTSLCLACGGGSTAPQHAAAPSAPEREHVHPVLPPHVDAFHEVLSPIWHGEPGAPRIALACENIATLQARVSTLLTEPMPAEARGKDERWKVATEELERQVGALASACAATDQRDVEDALTVVHEGYHKVASTVAEMGDHGDHRKPGGTGQHGGPGEH